MSPVDESDISLGDEVITPYGEGIVQKIFRNEFTVFIRGGGTYTCDQSEVTHADQNKSPAESKATNSTSSSKKTSTDSTDQNQPTSASEKTNQDSPKSVTESLPQHEIDQVRVGIEEDIPKKSQKRAALESLRLGTVPKFAVRETTIDHTNFLNDIEQTLIDTREQDSGHTLLFTGPNGSGKTHQLRLTEQRALEEGFVTASSELEGATKLTPKDVYREAVTSLQWPSGQGRRSGTLQDFLQAHQEELSSANIKPLSDSQVLYELLRKWRNTNRGIDPRIWDWIHGEEKYAKVLEGTQFKSTWLPLWGTAGQSLANAINGLAYLSRLLGYAGLLLIIDEVELILNQDVDWALRGREWIRGLILSVKGGEFTAANKTSFEEWVTDSYKEWTSWPSQNIQKSRTEWKLRYGGINPSRNAKNHGNSLNYAPCGSVPFVLALGYTNQTESGATIFDEEGTNRYGESWLPRSTVEQGILVMEAPSPEHISELVNKISSLYTEAYPEAETRIQEGLEKIESPLINLIQARLRTGAASSIRWATQLIVETLDRIATGMALEEIHTTLQE